MPDVNQMRRNAPGFDPRLFLRDDELDYGIALVIAGERALMTGVSDIARSLSIPELAARTLIVLRFQKSQTVTGLKEQLGATTPTFARIIGDLSKRGLIDRSKSEVDGRMRVLSLSTEGKRVTDPATLLMRGALRDAYRKAGASAVAGARSVLEALG